MPEHIKSRILRRFTAMTVATVVAVAFLWPSRVAAQTDAMLSHYFEVPSYYNPAHIGTSDLLQIRGAARLQWVGIDNSPRTFLGVANMPLRLFNKRFAIGAMMQQESAGLYKNLTIGLQLGYKQKLFKGELTGAVQIGLVDESFQGSKVFIPDNDDYHQSNDEAIPNVDVHGTQLDLGVGVHFTHKLFWAGLSCTHINSPTIKLMGQDGGPVGGGTSGAEGEDLKNFEFTVDRTLYFMAGSNIPIKNTLFEVMPSLMVMTNFTFYKGQVTARVRYNKFLMAGVGYRYNDAVTALLGAEFKGFYVGYSFDYSTTAIAKASSGSHEIVLGYNMKLDFSEKNKNRHKNIRIM